LTASGLEPEVMGVDARNRDLPDVVLELRENPFGQYVSGCPHDETDAVSRRSSAQPAPCSVRLPAAPLQGAFPLIAFDRFVRAARAETASGSPAFAHAVEQSRRLVFGLGAARANFDRRWG
jgi:hypothetical protein